MIKTFVMKLWKWYKGHEGVVDAHHTKYTDAEAVSAVNTDNRYIKKDGSIPLTADWDVGNGMKILADHIRARDGDGLKLFDDGGNGIFIKDGGNVGIGIPNPQGGLHLFRGESGTYPNPSYDDFVLESSGHIGISLLTPNNRASAFVFGVASDNNHAWIYHDYTSGTLRFGMGGASRMAIRSNGCIGVNTYTATALFDVNSDIFRLRTAKTPATAGAAGNQGDLCWDANYVYVCVATNTWKRSAISSW